jgi:RHS repeat-associated protein
MQIDDVSEVAGQFGEVCLSSYVYNGDGVRTRREGNWGRTWDYVWDVAAGLPVILNEMNRLYELDGATADGSVNNTYVYGLDLISVTDKDGNQSYFLYDGLGSTTDLTDGNGNVTTTYGYDVFGATRSQSGTPDTVFRFTGEQRDSDSDMYYLRARYYDPAIGRFLSQDPLRSLAISPQSLNRYPYVGSNPVNRVDPTGMVAWIKGGGGGSAKEGGSFGRLCPNYDPTHIYVIIDGVCYDATSPACSAGVNPLLCDGESGLFGFQPEKALRDVWDWTTGCEICGRIARGVVVYMECVGDLQVQTAALTAELISPEPGVAYVVVVAGGCTAVVAVQQTAGVNPLHP